MVDTNCEKCNTVIGTCLNCCGCKEHCNCGNFMESIQSALDEVEMNVSLEDLDHEWGKKEIIKEQ